MATNVAQQAKKIAQHYRRRKMLNKDVGVCLNRMMQENRPLYEAVLQALRKTTK